MTPKVEPVDVTLSRELFGELPGSWEYRKFSHGLKIKGGQVDPTEQPYSSMPLISPNHIESDTGRIQGIETAEAQGAQSGKYLCTSGDVIYSKIRPELAKATIAPEECLCSADMYPIDSGEEYQNEFIAWLLISAPFTQWVSLQSQRVAMPKVNRETLSRVRIPTPPIGQQRSISQYLARETGRIDDAISRAKTLSNHVREKLVSQTHYDIKGENDSATDKIDTGVESIGKLPNNWDVAKLGWLTDYIGSGTTPEGGSSAYVDNGITFLRSQNVQERGIDLSDVVFIDEETHQEMESTMVQDQDVLLNITGASLGRCALVSKEIPPANVNQHVCILRANKEKLRPEFLKHVISSPIVQNQIFANQNGASRDAVNFSQISNFQIPLPPIDEQSEIIGDIQAGRNHNWELIDRVEETIDLLEGLW